MDPPLPQNVKKVTCVPKLKKQTLTIETTDIGIPIIDSKKQTLTTATTDIGIQIIDSFKKKNPHTVFDASNIISCFNMTTGPKPYIINKLLSGQDTDM